MPKQKSCSLLTKVQEEKAKSPLLAQSQQSGKGPGTLGGTIPREHVALLYSILLPSKGLSIFQRTGSKLLCLHHTAEANATTQFYRGTVQDREYRCLLQELPSSLLAPSRQEQHCGYRLQVLSRVGSPDAFSKFKKRKKRQRLKLSHLPAVATVNI